MSTETPLAEVKPATDADIDWDAHCLAAGRVLGLDGPVARPVLEAALMDDGYAKSLFEARADGTRLQALLAAPPKPRLAGESSGAMLAGRLAASMARWASSGFDTVSPQTLERRRAACEACPHLADPPKSLARAIVPGFAGKVCVLCGCNMAAKTRLATSSCPRPHPSLPGMTRWSEPLGKMSE